MNTPSESKILEAIKNAFLHQDRYLFDKHVPEFKVNQEFLGDYFNQIAVQPRGDLPPRFFHTFSPFDVISNKAPHRSVVFESGRLLLDIDFDEHTVTRTAAMSSLVMLGLGYESMANLKILLIGSGRIATRSLAFLRAAFPDIETIECVTRSGNISEISSAAEGLGIRVVEGDIEEIGRYDIILCHTQADAPVIRSEHKNLIKRGAFIASFISSTEHGELADDYFSTDDANIICDWEATLVGAKELGRAIKSGLVDRGRVHFLKDFLERPQGVDRQKAYTIYRSTGTPIQNMAILQLLRDEI